MHGLSAANPQRGVGTIAFVCATVTSIRLSAPLALVDLFSSFGGQGTISSPILAAACAAAVRCWLCSDYWSCPLPADAIAFGHDLGGLEQWSSTKRLDLEQMFFREIA